MSHIDLVTMVKRLSGRDVMIAGVLLDVTNPPHARVTFDRAEAKGEVAGGLVLLEHDHDQIEMHVLRPDEVVRIVRWFREIRRGR